MAGSENGTNGTNGTNGHAKSGVVPLDLHAQLEGARLLLLGGTGFLGKIFWVMLLHRYPEMGKIFLLVRKSKTMTSEERFWSEVVPSECLNPLREQHGDAFEQFLREHIVPIDGDVGLPNCGIAEKLVKELKGTVDAVVNVAGVVDFNPPLDEALDTNAFGAQNLVALARALGDAPLLHTSTCYVVGNRKGLIMEETPGEQHPFPRSEELGRDLWDPAREIADCLDLITQAKHRCEDMFRQSVFLEQAQQNLTRRGEPTIGAPLEAELKNVKRKYVSDRLVEAGLERAEHWGWPNIYTYTKSIGEQIIAKSGLPFTIARPACCESTIEFPFPGWNEGIGTSAPIMFLTMKGHHQVMGGDAILDFIPADLVTAAMIVTLGELLEGTQKTVYQYGASDVNPGTSRRFGELSGLYKRKHFQRRGKGNPFVNFLQANFEPAIVDVERFDLVGPGQIARAARLLASGLKKAPGPAAKLARPAATALESAARQEDKIEHIFRLFQPFTSDQKGPFSCANTRAAYARLDAGERARLPWYPEKIDWADYWLNHHMPAIEKRVIPWMEERFKKELAPLKAHATLATLVDQMAERHEHALAFGRLEADGITRITYRDVQERANAVAARLAALGVQKGDRVVLCAHNHPDWPIAFFGIARAGATAVPIDPAIEPTAFANLVNESQAKVVLWDTKVSEEKTSAVEARLLADLTAPSDAPLARPEVTIEESDVASLLYTSGTTGKPKGVMLTHANFTSLVAALAPLFPLTGGDRVLSVLPLHHTFEFTCGMVLPFSRGARVVYLDELKGDRVATALKEARVTAMVGVPAVWQLLERRILSQVQARGPIVERAFEIGADLNRALGKSTGIDLGKVLFGTVHEALGGNIRYLISGGAALPKETQKLFAGLGFKLAEGYGLTEAAPVLTVAEAGSPAGQVGKPIPGVTIKILEPDQDGVGEVLAKGPNVMAGYTDAEETKEVLDADGFLRTGDLGKLDRNGRLVIVGRVKDVVITQTGENIYPDDVERLIGPIPNIAEIAIVGVTGRSGGERLGVLAVPEKDETVLRSLRRERAERSLREAIAKLPYGKQPTIVHLYDGDLPRTATRKVKRTEVRAILQRMIQATTRPETEQGQAPSSPVRVAIAAVKGRKVSEIRGDMTLADDLGFDSLALTELLVALEAKHGTIDPKDLQSCRTIADVEALVGAERASLRPPAVTNARYKIEGRRSEEEGKKPLVLPEPVQQQGKNLIGKLQDFFYGDMMRSKISGRAFIPHNRNTIVVANHGSHLDMGFVRHALGGYGEDIITLAAQDYFFEKNSLQRTFFENFTNLRAVDRKGGLRASERQAGEILTRGKTMLIFPEGTRSTDGEVHEFKPLLGHLAMRYGVDILPLYLGGTREAMPKGGKIPLKRDLFARIGPPITVSDMERLTKNLSPADAAREVAKLAHRAVVALKEGTLLDASRLATLEEKEKPKEHPLVTLFAELEAKFDKSAVDKPTSFYFTLGSDTFAKWTVRVSKDRCEVKPGKPDGGTADCVLKTSPEIFTKIVRDAYTPGPGEFLSGEIKSNDVGLLMTFQRVFQLGG